MDEKIYWIWLTKALGYGSRCANSLVSIINKPSELYGISRDELKEKNIFTDKEISNILNTPISIAEKIYNDCSKIGCRVLTPDDLEYPDRLRNISIMPLVLYIKGSLKGIDDTQAIAMIGTRNATEYGARISLELGRNLGDAGFTVISGMANGIDSFSIKGALRSSGNVIAVLGCGIDYDYPYKSEKAKKIIAKRGAVISEYPPGTAPSPQHFPIRNRLMSALSLGVLVVEAGEKSGTLITVGHALTQGKDVFAIPNDIFAPQGKGTLRLIKEGAIVVTEVKDIILQYPFYRDKIKAALEKSLDRKPLESSQTIVENLSENHINNNENENIKDNIDKSNNKGISSQYPLNSKEHTIEQKKNNAPDYLTDNQILVFRTLGKEPLTADEILEKTGLSMYELLSTITELEIFGVIVPMAGKRYVRK